MVHEREAEKLLKSLENLAKKHDAELEIRLDGSAVAAVKLEPKTGGGIKAIVGIKDTRKALASPVLLKAALSLFALRKALGKEKGKIDIEIESGTIKRLFGKKS